MLKHVLFIGLFLATGFSTIAQKVIKPSGNITSKTHDLTGFNGISISTDFKAIVTFASETSVRVEADDNMHPHILVDVKDRSLKVRHKDGLSIQGKETLIVHISVPSLKNISGTSDAIIVLENELKGDNLNLSLKGDSTLDGLINVGNFNVNLGGDSYLTATGSAKTLNANITGDSEIKNFDFVVQDLNLNLKGDSIAKLTVEGNMNLDLSGDSVLKYKGNPKVIKQHVRGDSEVHHMD